MIYTLSQLEGEVRIEAEQFPDLYLQSGSKLFEYVEGRCVVGVLDGNQGRHFDAQDFAELVARKADKVSDSTEVFGELCTQGRHT
jgi:hypothetical protein